MTINDSLWLGRTSGSAEVPNCIEKLIDFCRHDAYPRYDLVGYQHLAASDTIQSELLRAINGPMRARSPRTAWEPFLDRPLPELAQVSVDVDLIAAPEESYEEAREHLRACYAALTGGKWITDMAASKLLYLKRPNLVAISDSYIRRALGVADPKPGEYMGGAHYAARGVAVADAVRDAGRANRELLDELQTALAGQGFEMSLARIMDVLIWVDMAIAANHPWWGSRATERAWRPVQLAG